MPKFTAAEVKRLREITGAGMLDCKNALEEADGDVEKATELLRIKGAKDVGKRAGRTAASGLIATVDNALLELNCETDFVAKNEQFQKLAADLVALVAKARPADLEALTGLSLPDGRAVAEAVENANASMGEKIQIGRFAALDGSVATYMHRRSADLPPQVGVLVAYEGGDETVVRGAAMQIAAMRPRFVSRDDVPADVVDNERRIAEQTAREEGKPEQALPKIIEGRLNGFYKDVVLLEQSSVQESKRTVKQVLDEAGVRVTQFVRFEVGQA
jgi:elongation factor Ts